MSNQLSLFDTTLSTRRPHSWMGPHPDGPEATAPKQVLPGGLVARQQTEVAGDQYYYIYQGGTWLGSLFNVGGSTWSMYLPGERGVAEFGGPTLRAASKQLAALVSGKEVAHAR